MLSVGLAYNISYKRQEDFLSDTSVKIEHASKFSALNSLLEEEAVKILPPCCYTTRTVSP